MLWCLYLQSAQNHHGRLKTAGKQEEKSPVLCVRHGWQFCCDTKGTSLFLCPFREFDVLVEKIRTAEIEGIALEEIFNQSPCGVEILDSL